VAIIVAVLLTGLLGIVALALDCGIIQDSKRRVQATADAAALAAASQLFSSYPSITTNTPDPGGNAKTSALDYASQNGFANNGTTSTVTVNIPPASGPFKDKLGYAEVYVTYNQPRYFSTIWGSATVPVTARAVAMGKWAGTGNGVIVLDPSVAYALDANGSGSVTLTGGAAMIVNSDNNQAARTSGGGSLTAANFRITGTNPGDVGSGFNGSIVTGVLPTPDPLAYLPVPAVPPNGTMSQKALGQGNHQYTLSPGRYSNLPNFNAGDVVSFQQASANSNGGIFYIDGGGFTSTGATITMDPLTTGGVMIYNNPSNNSNSQGINISGNATGVVNLSPLTSGPYAGILFWQNRTAAQTLGISGNGSFTLQGTVYAANAQLSVTGNGLAVIGSQYISRTLALGGGGTTTINYSETATARLRQVRLVE